MRIYNGTKRLCIAGDACFADTFIARLKGLLGKEGLRRGQALVISPCISIHTFKMKFPIDAVFYDKDKTAVGVIRSMRPGRMSKLFFSAKGVVELAAGSIKQSDVEPGDKLFFSEVPPWPEERETG